jgi:TPR repeat protein
MTMRLSALATALALIVSPAMAQKAAPKKEQTPPPVKPNAGPGESTTGDIAYGAYQRGHYLTAFAVATKRVEETSDPVAMTLLAVLYGNGYGIPKDDTKAAEWYKIAADRGDREAMFGLAMFRISGRGGPKDRDEAARLFAAAAKLGHASAAYNLGLLYLEGVQFPQDFVRGAELFQVAANAGSPEAQYALASMYKEGRGVPKDPVQATRWLAAAALADHLDALVEYAIALHNGTGIAKDEATATAILRKAARRGAPIAQNRLARILATGRGAPIDAKEAVKWYIVSKAAGAKDDWLDDYASKQTPEIRAAAQKEAEPWLFLIANSRS